MFDSHSKTVSAVALQDACESVRKWRLWTLMGWREIVRRYRRTSLGPFWTTASLAIFVLTIGFMYSTVWNTELAKYLPYLAGGFIIWTMISGTISESCTAFTTAEPLLRQVRLSYLGLVYAVVIRNLIVTAHHMVIYAVVILIYPPPLGWQVLWVIPGLVLWIFNAVWIGLVLAIACTRYRDVQQLVLSVLQIAMFVTPVLYPVDALLRLRGQAALLVYLNPLHHYIDIIRAPLLGQAPSLLSYQVVIGLTVVGGAFSLWLLGRVRDRIVFWL